MKILRWYNYTGKKREGMIMVSDKGSGSLSEQVANRIKEYILLNDLKSGDKIPPEYELSQIMNAGRSTVREAVKYLASRNVLEVRQGAGTFVAEEMGVVDDPFGIEFIQDKDRMTHDLIEMRKIIEPPIAALAAQNATMQDIFELEQILSRVETKMLAGEDYLPDDILFHKRIAESSKNIVVPKIIPLISQTVEAITAGTNKKMVKETIVMHRKILDGIKAHNSVRTKESMLLHLVYSQVYMEDKKKKENEEM